MRYLKPSAAAGGSRSLSPALWALPLAAFMLGYVFLAYYLRPSSYVKLTVEDHWAEYCTAFSFLLAGVLLLVASRRTGARGRRWAYASAGAVALFIAAEELSWGQRILGFETPELMKQLNRQDELNVHNLEAFSNIGRNSTLSILVQAWLAASIVLACVPDLRARFERAGLLALRAPLWPLFATYPFVMRGPLVLISRDEIAEWLLGAAVLLWALDVFLGETRAATSRRRGLTWVGGAVAGVALGAVLFSALFPNERSVRWSLNHFAAESYPAVGLYRQSNALFEYLYAHPRHLATETRIRHGKLLLDQGRNADAQRVLGEALHELTQRDRETSSNLRRIAAVLSLLGRAQEADAYFQRALARDQGRLDREGDAAKRAALLWSMAETWRARGDLAQATEIARRSRAIDPSVTPRARVAELELELWLERAPSRALSRAALEAH